jgi:DNA-binding NarL/FixJ family response regulator
MTPRKVQNPVFSSRLMLEHTDRRGRVSLLPVSNATQRLAAAGVVPSHPVQSPTTPSRPRGETGSVLTAREWQVFDLLISGLSNKQMAHALLISPRTVEIHRARLMQKLGVRNTASLIRIAVGAA